VVTWIDRECTGLSDWNAKLERANGEIAELHVRISFQREIVKQLAAAGADTTLAQRVLDIRKERLARAMDHQRFIASQIGKADKARTSSEPLRFRWDRTP
jgi:uncharacterized protein (UPF0335 family)